ncbi:hypothetical protein TNIN_265461 [Trichonephila inaurata madagascariensis]|uniref:Uncharacterized protein n=1 Tax=Trichonephila inaurata madagascariensis TaxID=2747483 RepID=A0A8X6YM57_9ARAC|nr:hypothetical protein TNIN_265461 [Trichonephila inaurata madagascariensis]
MLSRFPNSITNVNRGLVAASTTPYPLLMKGVPQDNAATIVSHDKSCMIYAGRTHPKIDRLASLIDLGSKSGQGTLEGRICRDYNGIGNNALSYGVVSVRSAAI